MQKPSRITLAATLFLLLAVPFYIEGQAPPQDDLDALKAELRMLREAVDVKTKQIAELKAEKDKATQPFRDEIAALKAQVQQLQEEVAKAKEANANLTKQLALFKNKTGKGLSFIPTGGDETPLTKVKASPQDYIGKPFIVVGAMRVRDYFNFGYGNAQDTHTSLTLGELRPDATSTQEHIDLYVRKEVGKTLVDKLVESKSSGASAKVIRVKVVMLPERYDKDQGLMAELLDWQFLDDSKDNWGPWQCVPEPKGPKQPQQPKR